MVKKAEKSEKATKKAPKAKKTPKKTSSSKKTGDLPIQPEVNIGLVGHVDHGKTTLTEKLSGKWTDTHSEELKRGITIRLGYADVELYQCPKCKKPKCYGTKKTCQYCKTKTDPVRKVSFVDAPGHESLMATMLAGTTIMDGVLLLVAANESCPQPQTREHLMALQIMGVKQVIVIQNKIDLVKKEQAVKNYQEIKAFLKGTNFEKAPIIPLSAKHNVNIDALINAIQTEIKTPNRDEKKDPLFFIARSFDINKPGSNPQDMIGGVLGGALVQGIFVNGDKIEIKPGQKKEKGNKVMYEPIKTTIIGLKTGGKDVEKITPGGSVGILTQLDPAIIKSDALTGNVVGHEGKLPPVMQTVTMQVSLLKRVVGAKHETEVAPIKLNEALMLNVNAAATVGVVTKLGKNKCTCHLKIPVCAEKGSRITISRLVANRFRLIGYGMLE